MLRNSGCLQGARIKMINSILHIFQYLNDPHLTWRFQSLCGVQKLPDFKPATVRESGETPSLPSRFRIRSHSLYYLFKFGSFLGQEEFYLLFFPFWFWNVDWPVGRKVYTVWALAMFIGGGLKDYLRVPRPASPPVVVLETTYSAEFGMPSTHSIVSAAIPFTLYYFESENCYVNPYLAMLGVCVWASLVSFSRLYLGVHSFLEILAGLLFSVILMVIVLPVLSDVDRWLVESSPGIVPVLGIIFAYISSYLYPSKQWGGSYDDSVGIFAGLSGIIAGCWLGHQIGFFYFLPGCQLPTTFSPPNIPISAIQMIFSYAIVHVTRLVMKLLTFGAASKLTDIPVSVLKEKKPRHIMLPCKFITYLVISFNVAFTAPYFAAKIFDPLK